MDRTYLPVHKEWGCRKNSPFSPLNWARVSAGLWLSPRSGSWKCAWEPALSLLLFDFFAQVTVDLTSGPLGSKNGYCTAHVALVKFRIGNAVFVTVMICRTGGSVETGRIGCHHLSVFSVGSKEKNHCLPLAIDYWSFLTNGLKSCWCKLD